MGLQGQEAFVAVFPDGLLQDLGNLAVAGGADNVLVLAGHSVLDVDVGNVLLQQLPALLSVLAALNEVCEVESSLEVGGSQLVQDDLAAGTDVAVDVLLVFVDQDDAVLGGDVGEASQLLQNLFLPFVGVLVQHPEAEHTDVLAVQQVADLAQGVQLLQLLFVSGIVVNVDLADGAAQRGNLHACGIQPGQDAFLDLLNGVLCNALAVSGAQADVLHTQFLDHLQLNVQLGIDLIGKAGDDNFLNHGNLSPSFFWFSQKTMGDFMHIVQLHNFHRAYYHPFVHINHDIILFCKHHCKSCLTHCKNCYML